jgi:hypothetical protein
MLFTPGDYLFERHSKMCYVDFIIDIDVIVTWHDVSNSRQQFAHTYCNEIDHAECSA